MPTLDLTLTSDEEDAPASTSASRLAPQHQHKRSPHHFPGQSSTQQHTPRVGTSASAWASASSAGPRYSQGAPSSSRRESDAFPAAGGTANKAAVKGPAVGGHTGSSGKVNSKGKAKQTETINLSDSDDDSLPNPKDLPSQPFSSAKQPSSSSNRHPSSRSPARTTRSPSSSSELTIINNEKSNRRQTYGGLDSAHDRNKPRQSLPQLPSTSASQLKPSPSTTSQQTPHRPPQPSTSTSTASSAAKAARSSLAHPGSSHTLPSKSRAPLRSSPDPLFRTAKHPDPPSSARVGGGAQGLRVGPPPRPSDPIVLGDSDDSDIEFIEPSAPRQPIPTGQAQRFGTAKKPDGAVEEPATRPREQQQQPQKNSDESIERPLRRDELPPARSERDDRDEEVVGRNEQDEQDEQDDQDEQDEQDEQKRRPAGTDEPPDRDRRDKVVEKEKGDRLEQVERFEAAMKAVPPSSSTASRPQPNTSASTLVGPVPLPRRTASPPPPPPREQVSPSPPRQQQLSPNAASRAPASFAQALAQVRDAALASAAALQPYVNPPPAGTASSQAAESSPRLGAQQSAPAEQTSSVQEQRPAVPTAGSGFASGSDDESIADGLASGGDSEADGEEGCSRSHPAGAPEEHEEDAKKEERCEVWPDAGPRALQHGSAAAFDSSNRLHGGFAGSESDSSALGADEVVQDSEEEPVGPRRRPPGRANVVPNSEDEDDPPASTKIDSLSTGAAAPAPVASTAARQRPIARKSNQGGRPSRPVSATLARSSPFPAFTPRPASSSAHSPTPAAPAVASPSNLPSSSHAPQSLPAPPKFRAIKSHARPPPSGSSAQKPAPCPTIPSPASVTDTPAAKPASSAPDSASRTSRKRAIDSASPEHTSDSAPRSRKRPHREATRPKPKLPAVLARRTKGKDRADGVEVQLSKEVSSQPLSLETIDLVATDTQDDPVKSAEFKAAVEAYKTSQRSLLPWQREFGGPSFDYREEFSTEIQDFVNGLEKRWAAEGDYAEPCRYRYKQLFEEMVNETNRMEYPPDSPYHPKIRVIPAIGAPPAAMSSPPFEFVYTNRVVYSDDILPKKPPGCGCIGNCGSPANKAKCACLRRQVAASTTRPEGGQRSCIQDFAYDKDGVLDDTFFTATDRIIECNAECGCGPECQNRVVGQRKGVSVDIYYAGIKGWGVRLAPTWYEENTGIHHVARTIKRGEPLAVYAGELMRSPEAYKREDTTYTHINRSYVYDLDAWQLGEDLRASASAVTIKKVVDTHHDPASKSIHTDDASFSSLYSVDAMCAGNWTRFANHVCSGFNAVPRAVTVDDDDISKPLWVFFALRDIHPGEEISISYFSETDAARDFDEWAAEHDKRLRDWKLMADKKRAKASGMFKCFCKSDYCRGVMFRPREGDDSSSSDDGATEP